MDDFLPLNRLENALVDVRESRSTTDEFLRLFVRSDIAIPSATEILPDGSGFRPLLFDRSGTPMLAAFTDKSRVSDYIHLAKFCLTINGLEALKRLPPGHGLVINPGYRTGLEIAPHGIPEIIKDMG